MKKNYNNIISVIIPFYKGNKYVKGLLTMINDNSKLINGFGYQIECIIVNDSPRVVVEYDTELVKTFTLKVINNTENSGIHKTKVNGLKESAGDYILFLDQDDKITDNFLYSQMMKFKEKPSADIVIANGYKEHPSGKQVIYKNIVAQKFAVHLFFYLYSSNLITSAGQCLIKKDSIPVEWCNNIVKHNGSDDYYLWLLMFMQNNNMIINEEKIYCHTYTGNNLSNDYGKILISCSEVIDMLKINHLSDVNIEKLMRRIQYKQEFISSKNFIKKLSILIKYFKYAVINIIYKLLF